MGVECTASFHCLNVVAIAKFIVEISELGTQEIREGQEKKDDPKSTPEVFCQRRKDAASCYKNSNIK